MGCDIHIIVERKDKNSGRWVGLFEASYVRVKEELVGPAVKNRNYEFFAALAGVRGKGPEPKGLPEDASDLARMEYGDHGDMHSHSYLPLKRFLEIAAKHQLRMPSVKAFIADKRLEDSRKSDPYEELAAKLFLDRLYIDPEYRPLEDHRVVFCFDN